MAALTRVVVRPFRHEGGHQAVLLRERLGERLEQKRLVAGRRRIVHGKRGLQHARPGLGVQAFDGHVHALAHVEQLAIEVALDRAAQNRIPEIAGRPVLHVAVVLGAHGVRRLAEHEEFVLQRGIGIESHVRRAIDHAVQQAARTDGGGIALEFRQEQQHVFAAGALFQRETARALRHDAHFCVGVCGVPAGVPGVVVELIVQVPPQHHVAEREPGTQHAQEFVAPQVLAQHDAVHIGQADLDMRERAGLHQPLCVFHRCYP